MIIIPFIDVELLELGITRTTARWLNPAGFIPANRLSKGIEGKSDIRTCGYK